MSRVENAILTREKLEAKVDSSDAWLFRAIICIYNRQTSDEKSTENTKYVNGRGFNGGIAKYFSSIARVIIWRISQFNKDPVTFAAFNPKLKTSGILTDKQKWLARKRLPKYFSQILKTLTE